MGLLICALGKDEREGIDYAGRVNKDANSRPHKTEAPLAFHLLVSGGCLYWKFGYVLSLYVMCK